MHEENLIRITTKTPHGVRTEDFTEERFAASLVDYVKAHGEHTLGSWLDAHGLTYDKALELIGRDTMERLPDDQVSALSTIGERFKPEAAPQTDVESAVQGHITGEMRLRQLAENADNMSTDELEKAMVNAGMQVPRSTLMR